MSKRNTKRKPKYAFGCVCEAGEELAPDLRYVQLDERLTAWVRLKLRLVDGCSVLAVSPRGKRKVGRYLAGPPEQFAEYVDAFRGTGSRRKVPLSGLSAIVRVVGMSENLLASEQRTRGRKPRASAA